MALKLKEGYDKNPMDIYSPKFTGRKLRFDPTTVDPKEYIKFKALGFKIFICDECGSGECYSDCMEEIKTDVKKVAGTKQVAYVDDKDVETILDNVEGSEPTKGTEVVEEISDMGKELADLNLKELRELYPDIKSISREDFIVQVLKLETDEK